MMATAMETVTYQVLDGGIFEIRYIGQCVPERALAVSEHVKKHIHEQGHPVGLLLDVSADLAISIVRLSSLVEMLSRLQVPLAVVFGRQQQQELANLLHHTLINREQIAYFTDFDAACGFLSASITSST
jgi:hypothetical protein